MLSTLMFNCLVASRNLQRLAFDQSSSYFFCAHAPEYCPGFAAKRPFFSGISLIEASMSVKRIASSSSSDKATSSKSASARPAA